MKWIVKRVKVTLGGRRPRGASWGSRRRDLGVRTRQASEKQVRREHEAANGRFTPGLPAIGDGAMLFLVHVASKMRDVDEHGRGGRAGIVLNGSPLFNGGAGSGPSDIRGHLLENDLIDTIVALPTDMFYNTGIATYLWILDNTKQPERKGKVQLIDATGFATKMRKSLGNKRVEISEADRAKVLQAYATMADSDISCHTPSTQ